MSKSTSQTTVEIRPNPGPQETFLSSPADIAIYGGAAGGGKTYAILLEPLRHVRNPHFAAVILRRTSPEITKAGGLWDESSSLYPGLSAQPKVSNLSWHFPSGAKIEFGHFEHETDKLKWHGAQIPLIIFDELTTFTESQFWYLFSRNRSTCGVRPYIRATCNPDATSWLAILIQWWIDQDTGYPIPERQGVLRWFVRMDRKFHWADTPDELRKQFPGSEPKSLTFIAAKLEDNPALMEKDPGYRANLLALPKYDRERLLGGNWKQRPEGGEFDAEWFTDCWFEKWPAGLILKTMALDPSKGKSDKSRDYQAFVKVGIDQTDTIYVEADMRRRPIPQMVAVGVDLYLEWQPQAFGVESNSFQELLAPDFQEEFQRQNVLAPEVWQMNNTVNKQVRIRRLAGYLAHRRIRFMLNSPGTQILVDQLMDFPDGEHDDGPDALEMAIRLAEQLSNG